jgi:hypothetical protein
MENAGNGIIHLDPWISKIGRGQRIRKYDGRP